MDIAKETSRDLEVRTAHLRANGLVCYGAIEAARGAANRPGMRLHSRRDVKGWLSIAATRRLCAAERGQDPSCEDGISSALRCAKPPRRGEPVHSKRRQEYARPGHHCRSRDASAQTPR